MRIVPARNRSHSALGISLALLLWLASGGCAMVGQHLVLPGQAQATPAGMLPSSPDYELVSFNTQDGTRIGAQFGRALEADGRMSADFSHRPTVIFFYGMKHTAASGGTQGLFLKLRHLGVNVLIPDFPGYGMSEGRPSENGFYATAEASFDYLHARADLDPDRIVAMGWSLGTAPAIHLASRRSVAGLMTIGAFTNVTDMSRQLYPNTPDWLLSSFFSATRFDNLAKISAVTCPILIIHGRQDRLVPPSMADRLAEAAKAPVTQQWIAGAGHDNLWQVGGATLEAAVSAWLRSLGH